MYGTNSPWLFAASLSVCCGAVSASCQYGRTYLDQCDNVCFCDKFGAYQCKPRGTPGGGICYGDAVTGQPASCEQHGEIRVEAHTRFFCEDNIVHFEYGEDFQPGFFMCELSYDC